MEAKRERATRRAFHDTNLKAVTQWCALDGEKLSLLVLQVMGKHGLTQLQLAQLLGVTRQTVISYIEGTPRRIGHSLGYMLRTMFEAPTMFDFMKSIGELDESKDV